MSNRLTIASAATRMAHGVPFTHRGITGQWVPVCGNLSIRSEVTGDDALSVKVRAAADAYHERYLTTYSREYAADDVAYFLRQGGRAVLAIMGDGRILDHTEGMTRVSTRARIAYMNAAWPIALRIQRDYGRGRVESVV